MDQAGVPEVPASGSQRQRPEEVRGKGVIQFHIGLGAGNASGKGSRPRVQRFHQASKEAGEGSKHLAVVSSAFNGVQGQPLMMVVAHSSECR
jgi:hypothetical protein